MAASYRKIGIIREGKEPADRRVPLTPAQCKEVMQRYPEVDLVVQRSPVRAFSDAEYETFEIPMAVMNCPGSYMAHFVAALPNHIWMEVFNAGRTVGMKVDTRIEDGWIILGDAPGNGITFDEAKLAELAVDESTATSTALPAGRRRGAALYEVGPDETGELELE